MDHYSELEWFVAGFMAAYGLALIVLAALVIVAPTIERREP